MAIDSTSGNDGSGQVFHLPVRSRSFTPAEAAVYLGITRRRLGLLTLLGAGPASRAQSGRSASFARDILDDYVRQLHENVGISETETLRRRAERAGLREGGLLDLRTRSDALPPPADPFMMLATGREVCEHGIYMVLKMLALFGFIMLCISSTPLLRAHFN